MRTVFLFALLAAVALASKLFDEHCAKFDRHYEGREYLKREHIFLENYKNYGYDAKFFDMTKDEWRSKYLSPRAPTHLAQACMQSGEYAHGIPKEVQTHPDKWDWRDTPNVVLSVQDQASCGSCWAFSTAENIEGQNGMTKNSMAGTTLSPQFVVDCSKGCSSEIYMGSNTTVCNGGCNGGWPWTALDDLTIGTAYTIGGVPSWSSYKYTGTTGTCKKATFPTAQPAGYDCIGLDNNGDEDSMAEYLYLNGPLSIAIDADPFYSYNYAVNPVIPATDCPSPTVYLDHAILVVGYDDTASPPYWIVKNSWAASWGGYGGYALMEKGKGACGINQAVSCAKGVTVNTN